ncbi:uncharacterized protein LOC135494504 [Lineus longissimus]|uniref:uncharacterized protein LOC135494504 n=1 Tax=Lineus longissimus TaxID=88925 RepID=UPI00315D6594
MDLQESDESSWISASSDDEISKSSEDSFSIRPLNDEGDEEFTSGAESVEILDVLEPHVYDPDAEESGEESDESADQLADWRRLCTPVTISDWCKCGPNCQTMPKEKECRCCREYGQTVHKMEEAEDVTGVLPACITEHPGFYSVCLDPWNLQNAWSFYRQQYGGRLSRDPAM